MDLIFIVGCPYCGGQTIRAVSTKEVWGSEEKFYVPLTIYYTVCAGCLRLIVCGAPPFVPGGGVGPTHLIEDFYKKRW